jgi:ketosteroid isomerase-like protein
MAADDNKELVRRFYEEVWDKGNIDVADDVFAHDYVRHDLRATNAAPGPEGQKQIARAFRAAFSTCASRSRSSSPKATTSQHAGRLAERIPGPGGRWRRRAAR